ncbi:Pentatricopeptide repeat-containing protein [Dichanthelium oligosanthes]|uniref:Pentatricopeptide repeat-containing protein n=1 Tax=Dichanthelium oligosanthes TaxID=888268 RepID=A0A1E5WGK4_9POAL|nr:Pentatricopeptide repeat-containing protein [Dichanthelium oligosanthes]
MQLRRASMAPLPLPTPAITSPHPSKPHDAPAPAPRPAASSPHAALASLSQHAHAHDGALRDAFALVARAERQSSPAAAVSVGPEMYASLLQCCVAAESLRAGRQVHAALVKRGPYYCRNTYVGTKLAVFYARCGALADAERAFEALPERYRNAFAWAAVIGLWSRAGLHARALDGFAAMLEAGVPADNFVVPTVLKACAGLGLFRAGRAVHGYAWKAGIAECVYVMSSLVDFYGKCGQVEDAREVFDAMPERTVVSWNSMLMAYIHNGRIDEAVELFYEMRVEGVLPTRVSVVSLLSASAELEAVDGGRQGHAVAVSSGLEIDHTQFAQFGIRLCSVLQCWPLLGISEDKRQALSFTSHARCSRRAGWVAGSPLPAVDTRGPRRKAGRDDAGQVSARRHVGTGRLAPALLSAEARRTMAGSPKRSPTMCLPPVKRAQVPVPSTRPPPPATFVNVRDDRVNCCPATLPAAPLALMRFCSVLLGLLRAGRNVAAGVDQILIS